MMQVAFRGKGLLASLLLLLATGVCTDAFADAPSPPAHYGPVPDTVVHSLGMIDAGDSILSHDQSRFELVSVSLQAGRQYHVWAGSYYYRPYVWIQSASGIAHPNHLIAEAQGVWRSNYGPVSNQAGIAETWFTPSYSGLYWVAVNTMQGYEYGDYRLVITRQ